MREFWSHLTIFRNEILACFFLVFFSKINISNFWFSSLKSIMSKFVYWKWALFSKNISVPSYSVKNLHNTVLYLDGGVWGIPGILCIVAGVGPLCIPICCPGLLAWIFPVPLMVPIKKQQINHENDKCIKCDFTGSLSWSQHVLTNFRSRISQFL